MKNEELSGVLYFVYKYARLITITELFVFIALMVFTKINENLLFFISILFVLVVTLIEYYVDSTYEDLD